MENDRTTSTTSSSDKNIADTQRNPGVSDQGGADDRNTDPKQPDDEVAEGHWKSTTDGSGTSETD